MEHACLRRPIPFNKEPNPNRPPYKLVRKDQVPDQFLGCSGRHSTLSITLDGRSSVPHSKGLVLYQSNQSTLPAPHRHQHDRQLSTVAEPQRFSMFYQLGRAVGHTVKTDSLTRTAGLFDFQGGPEKSFSFAGLYFFHTQAELHVFLLKT